MKILVTEKIAQKGIDVLIKAGMEVSDMPDIEREELLDIVSEYDAIIVRGATDVDEELYDCATNLKVIGRAGNGVSNIDMSGATKRGIIVVNTPEANTISTAEHTIALMLASARNVASASAYLKSHQWERNKFKGSELCNKTLGIIGLGRVGSQVATRMKAFDMNIIAFDPYISDERFERLGVTKKNSLAEVVSECDILTVHVPKTKETIGIIGEEQFRIAKRGIRIVNCARAGIVDELALYQAILDGTVASGAIDMLVDEPRLVSPLLECENMIFTPHLASDTFEAQDNVSITVAQEVLGSLTGDMVPNAVNLPAMDHDKLEEIRGYLLLGERLGNLYFGLSKDAIKKVEIQFGSDIANLDTKSVSLAVIKGLLEPIMHGTVNYVNASYIANEHNIEIASSINTSMNSQGNLIRITVIGQNTVQRYAGVVYGHEDVRFTELNGYKFDIVPTSHMLFVRCNDKPGMIGRIGTLLGGKEINIITMQYSGSGDMAMMALSVDTFISTDILAEIAELEGVTMADFVHLYYA